MDHAERLFKPREGALLRFALPRAAPVAKEHDATVARRQPSFAGDATLWLEHVWKDGGVSHHNFQCLQDTGGLSRQTRCRVARSGLRRETDVWRREHIRLAKYVLRRRTPTHELAGLRQ